MVLKALSPVLLVFALALIWPACTNLELDPLHERVHSSLEGGMTAPGDITPADPQNFVFAVVGDPHIGSPGGETFKGIVSRVASDGDAFLMMMGDLTDSGEPGQYRMFLRLVEGAGLEYRSAIGNHDIFFDGWKNFRRFIGPSVYSFDVGNTHFSVLDSANGVIGFKQFKWLEKDLKATSQTNKIIVTHYPPWNGHFSSIFKLGLEEEIAILKDMAYRYDVDIVLSGHYHGFASTKFGGVRYIVSGGGNDLRDLAQRQNYVRIHVNGSSLRVEVVYLP